MKAPVAVLAIGNRSRGDDAAAPALLDRFAAWLHAGAREGEFELLEAYQLQVEHCLDIDGRDLVLFLDASRRGGVHLREQRMRPGIAATHALAPSELLDVHARVTGHESPAAFTLEVPGNRFELGEGLSVPTLVALEEAHSLLCRLAEEPTVSAWRALASTKARDGSPQPVP